MPFFQGRCVICGGPGISDAYYCKECTIQVGINFNSIFGQPFDTGQAMAVRSIYKLAISTIYIYPLQVRNVMVV